VFSRGGRNPSSPAEVSSHLRLGLNYWQNILSQGILTLQCVSLVGHRSLPLLFLEMFQDPSVPLSASVCYAHEQGSESLGLSSCLWQIWIIPGGRQHRQIHHEQLVLTDVQIQDSHFFCNRHSLGWFTKELLKYPCESHVPGVTRRPVEPLQVGKWGGEHPSDVCSSYQMDVFSGLKFCLEGEWEALGQNCLYS